MDRNRAWGTGLGYSIYSIPPKRRLDSRGGKDRTEVKRRNGR